MRLLKAIAGALVFLGAATMFVAMCIKWPIVIVVAFVVFVFCILVYGFYELQGQI